MLIQLCFLEIHSDADPALGLSEVIYAFVDRRSGRLLYIGIVVTGLLRDRVYCEQKRGILAKWGANNVGVVYAGSGDLPGTPATRARVLREIEGILIFEEQPPENRQNKNTCRNEYGLRIRCKGKWHGTHREYWPDTWDLGS